MRSRRVRAVVVALWLAGIVAVLQWQYPGFWVSPDEHYRAALEHRDAGELEQAFQRLEAALSQDEDNPGYLTARGYLELELDRPEAAAASFRRARELAPEEAEIHLGLAEALIRAGRTSEAVTALADVEPYLETAGQRHRRARMLSELGHFTDALTAFLRLLEEEPENPELLAEAGRAAAGAGHWDRVIELARRELATEPPPEARREARSRKADALRAAGRPAEAYAVYREIAAPENLRARAELALELERFGEAADLHADLVDRLRDEDEPALSEREDLAYALQRAGRPAEAEPHYRELLEEVETETAERRLRIRYAWLLNSAGRHDEAWEILDPLARPARGPALHELQAVTAVWAGRDEEAVDLLRAWLERPERATVLPRPLARVELARLLAARDQRREAVALYLRALDDRPRDVEARGEVARLLEAGGRLDEALRQRLLLVERLERPEPELLLRIARLHAWTGDPAGAADWYRDFLATEPGPAKAEEARWELALVLREEGRWRESLEALEGVDVPARGPDGLRMAAGIATEAGDAAAAARWLEGLEEVRPLDRQERRWLAAQLAAAGREEDALARYEELAAEIEPPPADLLATIGHLRRDLGEERAALEAFRAIPPEELTLEDRLAVARLTDRLDGGPAALPVYRALVRDHPDDGELRLEMARVAAAASMADTAVVHYLEAAERLGPDGLRVELAHNLLGAGRYRQAEGWARDALAAGEDTLEARLALGVSLQALGYSDLAHRELRPLAEAAWRGEVDRVMEARIAGARERRLEAWRLWEEIARISDFDPARAWLEGAEAALRRGDHARAARGLRRAREAGSDPAPLAKLDRRLDAATRPGLRPAFSGFRDANRVSLWGGRAGGGFWPSPAFRIRAEGGYGTLSQGPASFDRRVLSVGVDSLFPTPALELGGSVGREDYGAGGGALTTGRVSARIHLPDGSSVFFQGRQATPWTGFDDVDPRRFNRVEDLPLLGPDFRIREVRAGLDLRSGPADRRLLLEAGLADFEDGNQHRTLYGHWQLPVHRILGAWTVLRPNLYVESFRDEAEAYFSPDLLGSLGLGFHAVRTLGNTVLEAEANPLLQWTDEDGVNPGFFGVLGVETTPASRFSVRGGSFFFLQGSRGDEYWIVRPLLEATVRLGPGRAEPR